LPNAQLITYPELVSQKIKLRVNDEPYKIVRIQSN